MTGPLLEKLIYAQHTLITAGQSQAEQNLDWVQAAGAHHGLQFNWGTLENVQI